MASSIDQALSRAQGTIPECVACGAVDMSSGMLLGVKTIESHPREVLDLVAAATADLFQGPNVTSIEKMFKKIRGVKDDTPYFKELIVNSENLIHVFLRSKKNTNNAVVFITRAGANLGLVLSKSRSCMEDLEGVL